MKVQAPFLSLIFSLLLLFNASAYAKKDSCSVPLDEKKSAPSIDLISSSGTPIDHDSLIDFIQAGGDTSLLEPQLSDIYSGVEQELIQYNTSFPAEKAVLEKPLRFESELAGSAGLVRARVTLADQSDVAFQMDFSLDLHATLVRNALLRKLGFTIPSPKYYPKIALQFPSLDERDSFINDLVLETGTTAARWVVGGQAEIDKNGLTLVFQDVALESAIMEVPPMHWGIFTESVFQSRRPFRSLLVPLTLLDIQESVNMYSFEPVKIFNETLVFNRSLADTFKSETSIGDVKWIARKIAKLTREDWIRILRAGKYPSDIEALLVEKTIGRVDQLMAVLNIPGLNFTPLPYNPYITYGSVMNGKATQENYEGYNLRFTHGDPLSPIRASELLRYFSIELINNGIKFALNYGNKYLQFIGPEKYIEKHQKDFYKQIADHFANNPNEPFVQPLQAWGGPVAGVNINASRNIVSGTYYGNDSQVQLVDSVSAGVSVGAFIGISGLQKFGVSVSPSAQFSRSYVHVRPIKDMKTAFKDNWAHIAVPFNMYQLSKAITEKEDQSTADAIKAFLAKMATGEMLVIVDGLNLSNATNIGIPIGAMLGLATPFTQISENVSITNSYAILSRTTIYKSEEGIQVYLSRINSGAHEITMDTNFFIKLLSLTGTKLYGKAHTRAFILPEKFEKEDEQKKFQRAMIGLFRRNNPGVLEDSFQPYSLNHAANGSRLRVRLGPVQWTRRENIHELQITPPEDPEKKYIATDHTRTVVQGILTKINGTDFYGMFGSVLNYFVKFINIGGGMKGDDPSSNFLGKSKSFSVSTEIETTPSRENKTIVKLQQTLNGWSMKKSRLLKLMDKISEQLGEYSPNGNVINQDEFAQTRKVQKYTLFWNLLIYEDGVDKLLNVLNLDVYNTQNTLNHLANLMGREQYEQYCKDNGLPIGFYHGPVPFELYEKGFKNQALESSRGQTTLVTCVTPWMKTVFDLRSQLKKHPEVFEKNIHDRETAEEKVRWLNRAVGQLEKELDLNLLIKWVGKEKSFFQVTLSGFRTQDENGDSQYFSNTVGTLNINTLTGPMAEIQDSSKILLHELSARYLSDGF